MALHERVTPNGTRILFEDGHLDPETGKRKRRTYWLGEQTPATKVPSITTALGVMEKEGMHYSIEKLAVEASITLATSGGLPVDVDRALGQIKGRGLSFLQQWGAKADKGTDTHVYLERLLTNPDAEVPEHCAPFASAIREWWAEHQPEPIQSEVMVCSEQDRYAGRFDLFCGLPKLDNARARVELKSTEKLARHKKTGEVLPPYTEHLWQLAAQERAAVHSGDPASEVQGVLRVDEQGDWDFHVTQVEPRGFLAALSLYRALRGIPEPEPQSRLELEEVA